MIVKPIVFPRRRTHLTFILKIGSWCEAPLFYLLSWYTIFVVLPLNPPSEFTHLSKMNNSDALQVNFTVSFWQLREFVKNCTKDLCRQHAYRAWPLNYSPSRSWLPCKRVRVYVYIGVTVRRDFWWWLLSHTLAVSNPCLLCFAVGWLGRCEWVVVRPTPYAVLTFHAHINFPGW